jgi:Mrp family chromosome partitioning ATPase
MVIAGRVDGTLLVVDSKKTRSEAARSAVEALSKSGTYMLGGVLNKVGTRAGGYYYYYQSGYGEDNSGPPLMSANETNGPQQPQPVRKLGSRN